MKLTILVDNNTIIDRYLSGEPGVSYLIETEDIKILFDTGYSDMFIQNAKKLNINLLDIDYLVLSHGHIDHTGGLDPLLKLYAEESFEHIALKGRSIKRKKPNLVAHPDTLLRKYIPDTVEIGTFIGKENLYPFFDLNLNRSPVKITEKLLFLGEIERKNNFEALEPIGKTVIKGQESPDFLLDDSAMVYASEKGLVIITGCSHAGICNIISYAQKITGISKIVDVIGGFHLLDPPEMQMKETTSFIKNIKPETMHACHCTDLHSKIKLSNVVKLEEVGSGLVLEYS